MYVKISTISLFALLLIGGAITPSVVFGELGGVEEKYLPDGPECTLPDETITFSIDKDSYQYQDEIKVSGQVIPKKSTNFADLSKHFVYVTIPKAKSIFILPDISESASDFESTYDSENPSRMSQTNSLSTLDTTLRIDECGNFETSIKVIPLIFKNGFYVLNVKYAEEEIQKNVFILDEELQKGCFITKGFLSESGRCGDFKGETSDIEYESAPLPEVILTTDKDEYLPGELVSISGQIKNAVFDDNVNLSLVYQSTSNDTNELISKSISLRGVEPKFSLTYSIPSDVTGIGSYSVSAVTHLEKTTKTFIVDDESIVTDFAAEKTMNAPTIGLKKIIDKHNRITVSQFPISLGEKTSEDQVLLPRVLQGSLFTAARGDESSVNIQISTSSGQCIIGQDSMCIVNDSTRKSGSIYESVQINGKNYNVRYSGPDVRLEKFTIIPETSNTEIDTKNWDVIILKNEEPTKFYYKISYVLLE